ncbi:MAG TPA: hypothetical protein VKT33_08180 [Candidatus Angelobacter sp.]|nr:hypothetical protein [Candidatus Angelobacter sp.]
MKCEICKTIEKLGLGPATHEQWMCADAKSPRLALKKAQISIHHFWQEVSTLLQTKWQHAGHKLYQRAQYVTLGL